MRLLTNLTNRALFAADGEGAGGAPTSGSALYPNGGDTPTGGADTQAGTDSQTASDAGNDSVSGDSTTTGGGNDTLEAGGGNDTIEIKLPEGFEANEEQMSAFQALAREAGVSRENAQKLADLYFQGVEAFAAAQAKAFETTIKEWEGAIEKLPDFNTAEKRDAAQTMIGRALDEYGTPEAREAFDITGAGWNPHIVQTFYKMAKALSEGGPVGGGRPTSQRAGTPAQRLYGQ